VAFGWVNRRSLLAPAAQPWRLHLGQPHVRDGMGCRRPRHRHRPAHRRRGCLGAGHLLAMPVPDRTPMAARLWGPGDRAGDIRAQLRLLDRQRAAGRDAVERRDQTRRRRGVRLRRPELIGIMVIYRRYYGTAGRW